MIFITHIRMSPGGTKHEHIDRVKWNSSADGKTGDLSRAEMVSWLEQGNRAYVRDGVHSIEVKVVNATPKYLRTYRDGVPTDNLLSLPGF